MCKKPRPSRMGRTIKRTNKSIPSHFSGGGPGEALLLEKRPPLEFPCVFSILHVRGGSVSRRGRILLARNRTRLAWERTSKGTDKLIPSHSSGGGPGEALLLEKRPPPEFPCVSAMLHVRGGSVSRRGRILLARNRARLAWERTSKGTDKLIPSYSSGGGPGEALLLEKRPPPEVSPFTSVP